MIYVDDFIFGQEADINDATIELLGYDEERNMPYLRIGFEIKLADSPYSVYEVCQILKNAEQLKIDKLRGSHQPLFSNYFKVGYCDIWPWVVQDSKDETPPENMNVILRVYDF